VNSSDNSIINEIKASGRLPSPTGVALTILDLTRDPQTKIEAMAKVLRGDPSLSGQIIKYANSAAVGDRQHVGRFDQRRADQVGHAHGASALPRFFGLVEHPNRSL